MQVRAQLNRVRIAPRKVRAVVNLVKGKNVDDAIAQLEFMIKKPSVNILKLLRSAIANAENNFNMIRENLYIKEFTVDEGVKLKRFRAVGFGRSAAIQKKTNHIKLILDERVAGLKRQKKERKQAEKHARTESVQTKNEKKPEIKTELGSKKNVFSNLGKKIFRRKAI